VIYRSHSLLAASADECRPSVAEILRVARRNNARSGLTGVLLFDGANFLQAIEGEIGHLERIWESIACDQRHEDIELIEFEPIAERDYQAMPMVYIEGLSAEHDTLRHILSALTAPRNAEEGDIKSGDFEAGNAEARDIALSHAR
jgi:hypothetical protein